MDGTGKKTLTSEEMLAEARAFQNELNRTTDRRGGRTSNNMASPGRGPGGMSSPMSGAYGTRNRIAVGTPRGASGQQPVVQKLASPEQLFGLPTRPPASNPRNTSTPVTQQSAARPVDNFEHMQVDPHHDVPQVNKTAAEGTGRGLVSSRWATSGTPNIVSRTKPVSDFDGMDVDTESHVPKHASESKKPLDATDLGANTSKSVPAPFAHTVMAKGAGNAGVTMDKGKSFQFSSSQATLDTPEASSGSKGLLGSRWAFASPSTPKYPDPSTLEPVYRSENWLADLSEEYRAMSIKTKNAAAETQPNAAIQPAGSQFAAQIMKTLASGAQSQHSGQTHTKFLVAPQADATKQSAGGRAASDADPQHPETFKGRVVSSPAGPTRGPADLHDQSVQQSTNASPIVELSRTSASAQAASDQPLAPTTNTAPGGIFNDSTFKDWYNSQFMQRKA